MTGSQLDAGSGGDYACDGWTGDSSPTDYGWNIQIVYWNFNTLDKLRLDDDGHIYFYEDLGTSQVPNNISTEM